MNVGYPYKTLIVIVYFLSSKNGQLSKYRYGRATYLWCSEVINKLIHSNCGEKKDARIAGQKSWSIWVG